MERRSPLRAMSEKRRQRLAEQGNRSPFSTLTNGTPARSTFPTRKTNTGPTPSVRTLVAARSGGWCEWPGCPHTATDLHHRLNRKTGGRHGAAAARINGAAWLLAACRPHHEQVTSPTGDVRVRVEAMGWLLREHQDAETTPVLTRHHPLPVLLTAAGSMTTTPNHIPA
ncbi:hypothetical protein ABT336_14445 [Micromonospora sp. NPDC000207]|uniref:hypothetical protein n=1 Tax=Micromonospora sp. NPDC000207 TaxID=3154246 RepID=UPI003316718E